jgi:hypothetical protein
MIRSIKKTITAVSLAAISLAALGATGAQAESFTASSYPAAISGTSSGEGLDAFGAKVQCTESSFSGELTGPSEELATETTFNGCKLGVFPVTWDRAKKPCFRWTILSVHICTMEITIFASAAAHLQNKPICRWHIPEQTISYLSAFHWIRSATKPWYLIFTGILKGLKVTQIRESIVCPAGTETVTGEYTTQGGGVEMKGTEGTEVDIG